MVIEIITLNITRTIYSEIYCYIQSTLLWSLNVFLLFVVKRITYKLVDKVEGMGFVYILGSDGLIQIEYIISSVLFNLSD